MFLIFLFFFLLSFSVESSPALQTSSMLDCLATIQAIISFLQKSSTEQRLCNLFDQMELCCIQMQSSDDKNGCVIACQAVHKTVKSWKELIKEIFVDLCGVLFDGMCHLLLLKCWCLINNRKLQNPPGFSISNCNPNYSDSRRRLFGISVPNQKCGERELAKMSESAVDQFCFTYIMEYSISNFH